MTCPTDFIKHLPDFLGEIPLAFEQRQLACHSVEKQYINDVISLGKGAFVGKSLILCDISKVTSLLSFCTLKGIEGF